MKVKLISRRITKEGTFEIGDIIDVPVDQVDFLVRENIAVVIEPAPQTQPEKAKPAAETNSKSQAAETNSKSQVEAAQPKAGKGRKTK